MAATYSNTSKSPNRQRVQSPENFLEALRSLGKSTISEVTTQAKKAIFTDVPESFGLTSTGTLKPNESVNLDQMNQAQERGYREAESEFSSRLHLMRQEEHSRLLQAETASKQQIQSILVEIRELAKSMGDFSQEVQIAAAQIPVKPGLYHKNFYAHLKSVIAALRQKVDSSRNWLAAANGRAGKRGYYWSQVTTSGSKYMLSSERYMVTSTG
jgi:hypothetical protein